MSNVTIKQLGDAEVNAWNRFVEASDESTFFHLAQWREIFQRVLGHRSYYLYASREGQIEGIFPLVQVKSTLFGNALISVPFGVYGGCIADNDEVYRDLTNHAVELARELQVDYVEVRETAASTLDWENKDLYVTFIKPLAASEEENFKSIPRKQRAMVRKAIAYGLTSEWDKNIDRFYSMYSESVRNLGTPVLSKKYYQSLLETFKEQCSVLTIIDHGKPVASVLSFYFKDQVLPYYGGGTSAARASNANDFMYWELMRLSLEQGVKVFDFGRSKNGAGSFRFKKHWGFEPQPLYYRFHLATSG